ncbi:hypothetical protein BD408DRAFT_437063 [Parasitella parasitica]|nr:hypothetical protein BD408DRAFT_437063 [Parasitella parasitica]
MTEYFPPTQFANSSVAPGEDNTVFYDEEASSSATSTSPLGDLALGYPHGVDSVYYTPTAPQVFMRAYGYYGTPSYPQAYVSQQPMIHSSSMSSEDQIYLQNDEFIAATLSPTSTLSSVSYNTNAYMNNAQEIPILNDPAVQDGMEPIITSPASDDSSHFKRRVPHIQSAFSHLTLSNSSASAGSNIFEKQRSEPRKSEYSSYKHQTGLHNQHQREKNDPKKTHHIKKPTRTKGKKKCSNCHATDSPSWRRSICKTSEGELVCNACGLYEKTAQRKRMLVTSDDGTTKVVRKRDPRGFCCSKCGARDATRWRKLHDNTVHCERCVRGRR